uniref:Uncharacterized protein n=1 Tax=Eutreptiella gymnastica TaxID=73025 RepID=A0A7S4G177_9EUGL
MNAITRRAQVRERGGRGRLQILLWSACTGFPTYYSFTHALLKSPLSFCFLSIPPISLLDLGLFRNMYAQTLHGTIHAVFVMDTGDRVSSVKAVGQFFGAYIPGINKQ